MFPPDRPFSQLNRIDNELREIGAAVHSSDGPRHDPIRGNIGNMVVTQPIDVVAIDDGSEGASTGDLFEITTSQRMASAMTGSLLTSLLGEYHTASAQEAADVS